MTGGGSNTVERTVNSPGKGVMYTMQTNERNYIVIPSEDSSAAIGRVYYNVKRTVSGFETSGYIALGWGYDF